MALLWMDGFDRYGATADLTLRYTTDPQTVFEPTGGKWGGGAVSLTNPDDANHFYFAFPQITPAGGPIHCAFWMKMVDSLDGVGNRLVSFRNVANSDGAALACYNGESDKFAVRAYGGVTALTNFAHGMSASGWNHIEIYHKAADAGGFWKVWVNETLVCDYSGDTTSLTPVAYGGLFISAFDTVDYTLIDDLVVWDDTGNFKPAQLGYHRIWPVDVNADGDDNDWTASAGNRHQCVDETPFHNSDADYVSASAVGNRQLFNFAATPNPSPETIHAVQLSLRAKVDVSSTYGFQPVIKSAGNLYYGSYYKPGTSYAQRGFSANFNPGDATLLDALLVGYGALPRLMFYNVTDSYSTLDVAALFSTIPPASVYDIAFSPNGNLCAIAHSLSPYVSIYAVNGWVKLDNPSSLPPATCYGVAFSPDGSMLACAHTTSPYVTIYNTSDWSKITNPGTLPTGQGEGVAFSPDGSMLAVAHQNSPYITIYNTSDWSKITNPGTLPTGAAYQCHFSPDGSKLAVAHLFSPRITIYNTSDWSKITNPGTLPTGTAYSCAFSPDGTKLAVGHTTSPYVTIYNVSDWSKITNPGTLPAGQVNDVGWKDDNSRLACAHQNSPYITIYNTSDWSKIANPSTLPPGECFGATFFQFTTYNEGDGDEWTPTTINALQGGLELIDPWGGPWPPMAP